ncbi:unnamed protein product [Nesidiocoris tenuis]|uniref:Uncharacterized protein n=1 Tax=Nesidiocoris tenuis TaxID=355587 RepID=A0A6H5GYQ6_9HEMI|nr:unnamed protein product [Nesidiocoris tenuis]
METPGCAAPVENTELAEEKIPEKLPEKVTPSGIQLRTSARVIKKLKLDQEAALAALNSKKAEEAAKEEAPPPSDEKPQPKRRIIWSHDDKNAFFEALNEHGIKKSTQELYALINFGEWRKKVGHVVERNAQKLNELIYSGCTQVRVRGKAWRIKTPVCRALRRLNAFEDEGEDLKLPSRITVMITARSNKDAARVQAIAHNTRVKTTLSIDSSIQNITTFLSRRWSAAHGIDSLRVGPKKDAIPAQTNFKCGQVVTSSAVSLLAHERKTCSEGYDKVKALLTQLQIGKTKATLKYQREETAAVSNDTDVNSEVVDPKSLAPSSSSGSEELPGDMRSRIGQLYLMVFAKAGPSTAESIRSSPTDVASVTKADISGCDVFERSHCPPDIQRSTVSNSSIPSPKLASLTALTPASVTTFLQPSDAKASAKSETAEKHDLIESFENGILSKKASGTSAADSNGAGDNGNSAAAMLDVTPPTSPSRILKEGESQWLNADLIRIISFHCEPARRTECRMTWPPVFTAGPQSVLSAARSGPPIFTAGPPGGLSAARTGGSTVGGCALSRSLPKLKIFIFSTMGYLFLKKKKYSTR